MLYIHIYIVESSSNNSLISILKSSLVLETVSTKAEITNCTLFLRLLPRTLILALL